MNNNYITNQFVSKVERTGTASIPNEHIGAILNNFPVVGGGMGCIVVNVEDMIIRLAPGNTCWTAEHLVVRR